MTASKAVIVLVWLARVVIAGTFIAAAVPKLTDPAGFAETIANYQAFPYWSVNLLAGFVPMCELVGATTVLSGWKRRAGALMLGGLTLSFLLLIASVIIRGIDISCGCFGTAETASAAEQVGWPLFFRDVALLVGIGIAAWSPKSASE